MTLSEIHAVMTGGFATISGTVMGAFISFGVGIICLMAPGQHQVLQTLITKSGLTDWCIILNFCLCDGCPFCSCLVKAGISRSGGIQVQESGGGKIAPWVSPMRYIIWEMVRSGSQLRVELVREREKKKSGDCCGRSSKSPGEGIWFYIPSCLPLPLANSVDFLQLSNPPTCLSSACQYPLSLVSVQLHGN